MRGEWVETIDLQVGGVVVKGVLIDSGSSCNIVDWCMWEELKQKRDKMQVRENYPEVVSLWDIRTTEHPRKVSGHC